MNKFMNTNNSGDVGVMQRRGVEFTILASWNSPATLLSPLT